MGYIPVSLRSNSGTKTFATDPDDSVDAAVILVNARTIRNRWGTHIALSYRRGSRNAEKEWHRRRNLVSGLAAHLSGRTKKLSFLQIWKYHNYHLAVRHAELEKFVVDVLVIGGEHRLSADQTAQSTGRGFSDRTRNATDRNKGDACLGQSADH